MSKMDVNSTPTIARIFLDLLNSLKIIKELVFYPNAKDCYSFNMLSSILNFSFRVANRSLKQRGNFMFLNIWKENIFLGQRIYEQSYHLTVRKNSSKA